MASAECDTLSAYSMIESRNFGTAKELFRRSRSTWTSLIRSIGEQKAVCEETVEFESSQEITKNLSVIEGGFSHLSEMKDKAIKMEVLVAYLMTEHGDGYAGKQLLALLNVLKDVISKDGREEMIRINTKHPLQTLARKSHQLIGELLESTKDNSEYIQMAAYKNLEFLVEKLGCSLDADICKIFLGALEIPSKKEELKLTLTKSLHLQSITQKLLVIRHNVADACLNLFPNFSFSTLRNLFKSVSSSRFFPRNKGKERNSSLTNVKMAYLLRTLHICVERLHFIPSFLGIEDFLHSLSRILLFHKSDKIQKIIQEIWVLLIEFLPVQFFGNTKNSSSAGREYVGNMFMGYP